MAIVDTGVIIQARMKSTRLPGKVLLPFYGNLSILDILLGELRRSVFGLPLILATSTDSHDDVLDDWAQQNGIRLFRGSESNVLQRFLGAANAFELKSVVRICADNPFLDASLMDVLLEHSQNDDADYISYQAAPGVPAMKSHLGIFSEWVRVEALRKAADMTTDQLYTEHVTNFVYEHPQLFNVKWIKAPGMVYGVNDIRFTIDTPKDFELISRLYSILAERGIHPNFKDAVGLIQTDKEARSIMKSQIANFMK